MGANLCLDDDILTYSIMKEKTNESDEHLLLDGFIFPDDAIQYLISVRKKASI
jgi:hypothetical protein